MFLIYHISPISTHPTTKFFKIFLNCSAVNLATCPRARQNQTTQRTPLPQFIQLELATLVNSVPPGDEWLHEIKFDGYRSYF